MIHASRQSDPGSRLHPVVLIANSDPCARNWIEATVAATGLQAVSCGSAGELLSRFPANAAACAILDSTLPDASAFELLDKLSRAGATVMFVTRDRSLSSCVRALKAGAVDFLSTPCDAVELVRALRGAIREAYARLAQREQHRELHARFSQLTRREREVFWMVCSGALNKQIAQQFAISEVTVQIHRSRAMRKMHARSLVALVRMADKLQVDAADL
jgi:FixJ family two-component response regulator